MLRSRHGSIHECLQWEHDGDRIGTLDNLTGDYPHWIDASTMLSDPLTKVMKADRLIDTMMTGVFGMFPTEDSLSIKARSRELPKGNQRVKRKTSPRLKSSSMMRNSTSNRWQVMQYLHHLMFECNIAA